MVSGLEIRMNRIMNQGRMLCIPMDHGISNGPIPGLEDPHKSNSKMCKSWINECHNKQGRF